MRIIFILQNEAEGLAGGSRGKGGSVLGPCLPGGLAALLLAQGMCCSPALALKEGFESSLMGVTAKCLFEIALILQNPLERGKQQIPPEELQCTVLLLPLLWAHSLNHHPWGKRTSRAAGGWSQKVPALGTSFHSLSFFREQFLNIFLWKKKK